MTDEEEFFRVGDIVTRDGTDRQRIIKIDHGWGSLTVECITAPATGWMKVGEREENLIRRYSYPPPLDLAANTGCGPSATVAMLAGPEAAAITKPASGRG